MCRNIKSLFNVDPPATKDEMHDAALQFVRKISGSTRPSQANEAAFYNAVEEIKRSVHKLLQALETKVPPKDREVVASRARERAKQRYGRAV